MKLYIFVSFLITFPLLLGGRPLSADANQYLVKELPLESFAGQIPILRSGQNATNQNLFFWYFPAKHPKINDAPLIIWLQGGPGSSSMIGLFAEHGPLQFIDGKLFQRSESWNERYGVLYIDNPVGTGYSTVLDDNSQECIPVYNDLVPAYCGPYPVNQAAVAQDMLIFLSRFYGLFPHLASSSLFISGESYAGKYVPNIATALLKEKSINFKGVMIGDGLIDPSSQIHGSIEQALLFGLISPSQAAVLKQIASDAVLAGKRQDYLKASDMRLKILNSIEEFSGGINLYDIRKEKLNNSYQDIQTFMQLDSTKKMLHVSPDSNFLVRNPIVKSVFHGDIFKSSLDKINLLLEKRVPVLIYAGQFDLRDGIPGILPNVILGQYSLISNLEWSKKYEFLNSTRHQLMDGSNIVGYQTSYASLTLVELRNAGHLAPMDQPKYCKQMIYRFIVETTANFQVSALIINYT
jgi:vitellogenic carboxypeptidase-like protein